MTKTTRNALIAATACLSLILAGCSTDQSSPEARSGSSITVENCGTEVKLDHEPERATLLTIPPAPTLKELGVLDTVKAKAGAFPEVYFSDDVNQKLSEIPSITEKLDPAGHLEISREQIVATDPDVVITTTTDIREQLLQNSVPVLMEEGGCGGLEGDAKWEDIYTHIDLYAKAFGKEDRGEALKEEVKSQIEEASTEHSEESAPTAAVLYPTIGGGVDYAYGRGSMSNPVLEAAGLKNVFGDQSKRVFEVSAEQVVDKKPEVIVALYSDGNPEDVKQAIRELPGASSIPAVQEGKIIVLPIYMMEYASLLNLNGLHELKEALKD